MSGSKNKYKLTKFDFKPLKIEDEKIGEDLWKLLEDLRCHLTIDNRSFIYTLRKGFKTNYRSGPRWIDEFAPKIGSPKIQVSWMIHDANYEGYLTQQMADNLLFHMLVAGELPNFNARIIYLGLQIFGGFRYKNSADSPYIEFEQKIIPPVDPVSGEKRTATLGSSIETPITFEHDDKKTCEKQLIKIAKEHNFDYHQKDLDAYFD